MHLYKWGAYSSTIPNHTTTPYAKNEDHVHVCLGSPLTCGCGSELRPTTSSTSSSHLHRASHPTEPLYGAGVDDLDVHMLSACRRRVTTEPFRIISEGYCRSFCLLQTPPPRGPGRSGATSSSCLSTTCSSTGGTRGPCGIPRRDRYPRVASVGGGCCRLDR